jgi:hypothetical protein
MCLAIYKPAGKSIPTEHLEEGFLSNPHGAGFSYAINGELHSQKGFFKFNNFLKAYEKAVTKDAVALVHFRYATHGEQNEFNCHPWPACGGEYSVIHNGILNIQSTKEKSDTGHFVDEVLTPMLEKVASPDDPALRFLVESTIGSGNKILVMDVAGKVTIYNEKSGTWDEGIWYSNCGYLPVTNYYSGRFLPQYYHDSVPALQSSSKKKKSFSDDAFWSEDQRAAYPDYEGSRYVYEPITIEFTTDTEETCEFCDEHIAKGVTAYDDDEFGILCQRCYDYTDSERFANGERRKLLA